MSVSVAHVYMYSTFSLFQRELIPPVECPYLSLLHMFICTVPLAYFNVNWNYQWSVHVCLCCTCLHILLFYFSAELCEFHDARRFRVLLLSWDCSGIHKLRKGEPLISLYLFSKTGHKIEPCWKLRVIFLWNLYRHTLAASTAFCSHFNTIIFKWNMA